VDASREELHRLVDELPAEQVPGALAALRARGERRDKASWPPAWFGSVSGSAPDVAERADDILREGLGRRPA
jgi:hypothetical protein